MAGWLVGLLASWLPSHAGCDGGKPTS